jgi:chemotaxis protein histidine kinase CheA
MGTPPSLPDKSGLPQQMWDVVTTLTPEAQNAGLRKAEELGFDLNRGRIPLAETLINLDHARATLLDVVEKNKLGQIPLKLQYNLLAQVQRVGQNLQALLTGTDTIQALEDSVDDLTSSIWQYNLQNLSGEVLGFTQKMNQLKRQETLIREVHRQAEAFSSSRATAEEILSRLSEVDAAAGSTSTALTEASSRSGSLLSEIAKNAETAKSALAEIETSEGSASKSVEACAAAAEKASELLAETETAKHQGAAVVDTLNEALQLASTQLSQSNDAADALFEKLRGDCERTASSLQEEVEQANQLLTQSISLLRDGTKEEIDTTTVESRKAIDQQAKMIADLVTTSEARLEQAEKTQKIATEGSLQQFEKLREVKLKEVEAEFRKMSSDVEAIGTASIEQNDGELRRLTAELEALEGQIRESINRATGYSLFHSFQKRQEDLAKAKLYWAYALAVTVLISLIASGFFIYSLKFVHEYNAAFYLKLSISLPLIYAIAFCNLQYSRERSLEEEYAFKSSISISLDPYQRLVKSIVDEAKPEELSKYTAFLIESVNRVFSPPTAHRTTESEEKSGELVEGILKSVGKFCEPFLSVIKK